MIPMGVYMDDFKVLASLQVKLVSDLPNIDTRAKFRYSV